MEDDPEVARWELAQEETLCQSNWKAWFNTECALKLSEERCAQLIEEKGRLGQELSALKTREAVLDARAMALQATARQMALALKHVEGILH